MSWADKVGKTGRIKNGQHAGFLLRIEDDSQNTGGYLILIWRDIPPTGYDYWVEKLADIDQFMIGADWDVEWLNV
jgi:hypothetical protein